MRTIKFRAWRPSHPYPEQRMIADPLYRCDAKEVLEKEGIYKDWILEQFTGLLDRNGKEIYEGDVVKMDATRKGREKICIVRFEQGAFALYPNMTEQVDCDLFDGLMPTEEVIGNVHENPELLNV